MRSSKILETALELWDHASNADSRNLGEQQLRKGPYLLDAPTTPPRPVSFLLTCEETDAAWDGLARALNQMCRRSAIREISMTNDHGAQLDHATCDISGRWVDKIVHIIERGLSVSANGL